MAAVLRELDARIRTDAVPEGLPFSASEEFLARQRLLNLQTRHGGPPLEDAGAVYGDPQCQAADQVERVADLV